MGTPVPFLELKLHEPGNQQYFYVLTGANGDAKFKVVRGKKYLIDIFMKEKIAEVSIPEKSTQPVTQDITYDIPDDISGFDTTYVVSARKRQ